MNVPSLYTKFSFIFLCGLLLYSTVQAQEQKDSTFKSILDDSTKMKYNVTSVVLQTDQDVYYNRSSFTHPSNSLTGIQSYQSLFENNRYAQDLGNYLTPRGLVMPLSPHTIGARYGFSAYDDFAINPDSIKYFDTRSPYTQLDYTQGGKGQQRMYVTHSRNITSRWNVTAMVRRMASKKLLGRRSKTDRQAENWGFNLSTRYYSKNARYQFLGTVSSMSHVHYDQGGIVPDSIDLINDDLYDYELEMVRLYEATSRDKRVYARVYQQASLRSDSLIQMFNQLDFTSRYNTYQDITDSITFPGSLDSSMAYMKSEMYQGDLKLGVKGSSQRFFYALYYKGRYYNYKTPQATYFNQEGLNNMVGAELNIKLIQSLYAGAKTEQAPQTSEFFSEARLMHKWFDVRYQQFQYAPTLQEKQFYSSQFSWLNTFNNIRLGQLSALLRFKYGALSVSPSVHWMQYDNYVYFNEVARPVQYNSAIQLLTSTLNVSMNKRLWIVQNALQLNQSSNERIVRVPSWVNQTRLLLQGNLFKKATFMQFGVDVFFRSEWLGNNYMPIAQTYYLGQANSTFNQLNAYVLADVFLNMQVKTARFFVKMAYVNQGMNSNGYMITPYYSGMSRVFEFGVNWQFFD